MNIWVSLIFIAVFLLLVGYGHLFRQDVKKIIQEEIERLGGIPIEVSEKRGFSEGIIYYKVVFADQFGQKYNTECIVDTPKRLYWLKNPAELMSGQQPAPPENSQVNSTGFESRTKSSKEQIIDSLHAENQNLKEEIERLRSGLNRQRDA
ncbi:MAG: hypothetical protein QNJ45_16645 [Ardenticatenaceae bacterium]|nr:hypothetical protein [Ardenticatenaceae bacterium]